MMHTAWCSMKEVSYYFSRSSIYCQGYTGWKIDDLEKIWAGLLGWSQLLNPSDFPCFPLTYPYLFAIILTSHKCIAYETISICNLPYSTLAILPLDIINQTSESLYCMISHRVFVLLCTHPQNQHEQRKLHNTNKRCCTLEPMYKI